MMNVGLATAAKGPMLMDNVDHLLLDDEAKAVWGEFHTDLRKLEKDIEAKNLERGDYRTRAFIPSKLLISVSI